MALTAAKSIARPVCASRRAPVAAPKPLAVQRRVVVTRIGFLKGTNPAVAGSKRGDYVREGKRSQFMLNVLAETPEGSDPCQGQVTGVGKVPGSFPKATCGWPFSLLPADVSDYFEVGGFLASEVGRGVEEGLGQYACMGTEPLL